MTDKIEVMISGQATAQYVKHINITQEEFDELNVMLDSEDRKEQRRAIARIEEMLTGHDIVDVDDFELEDFRAVTE